MHLITDCIPPKCVPNVDLMKNAVLYKLSFSFRWEMGLELVSFCFLLSEQSRFWRVQSLKKVSGKTQINLISGGGLLAHSILYNCICTYMLFFFFPSVMGLECTYLSPFLGELHPQYCWSNALKFTAVWTKTHFWLKVPCEKCYADTWDGDNLFMLAIEKQRGKDI